MKKNSIEVLEFLLPDYLACYFINGDADQLSEQDVEEAKAFTRKHQISIVAMKEDSSFYHRNELNAVGCNCSTFIAHKVN